MITKYNDFLFENNENYITTDEKYLISKYSIDNYKYNPETKLIDVYGDINLSMEKLKELPCIRLGTVHGDFDCSLNNLTSLKYCPKTVIGEFRCQENSLTSLKYCPHEVGKSFDCHNNKLTSLEYCPYKINGYLFCEKNKLTNLDHCPKFIGLDLYCDSYLVKSIINYPLSILGGIVDEYGNPYKKIIKITNVINNNVEKYELLLDDRIKFFQQIMKDEPSTIPLLKGKITMPSKKTFI